MEAVERLLEVLQNKGMLPETLDKSQLDLSTPAQGNPIHVEADAKRTGLGAYLANRRILR